MPPSNLSKLEPGQLGEAAAMAARAFHDDPLSIHIIPDDRERRERLVHVFEFFLNFGLLYGQVRVISPRLEAMVIWQHSADAAMTPERAMLSGAQEMAAGLGEENHARMMASEDFMERVHTKHAPGDHIYLPVLCVDPAHQSQGLARPLLEEVLRQADQQGLDVFLETHKESNLGFYQHFGFEKAEECVLPVSGIAHWAMLRRPRA